MDVEMEGDTLEWIKLAAKQILSRCRVFAKRLEDRLLDEWNDELAYNTTDLRNELEATFKSATTPIFNLVLDCVVLRVANLTIRKIDNEQQQTPRRSQPSSAPAAEPTANVVKIQSKLSYDATQERILLVSRQIVARARIFITRLRRTLIREMIDELMENNTTDLYDELEAKFQNNSTPINDSVIDSFVLKAVGSIIHKMANEQQQQQQQTPRRSQPQSESTLHSKIQIGDEEYWWKIWF